MNVVKVKEEKTNSCYTNPSYRLIFVLQILLCFFDVMVIIKTKGVWKTKNSKLSLLKRFNLLYKFIRFARQIISFYLIKET